MKLALGQIITPGLFNRMLKDVTDEAEKARFLGTQEPPTNLSEHAGPGLNKAGDVEVESDD